MKRTTLPVLLAVALATACSRKPTEPAERVAPEVAPAVRLLEASRRGEPAEEDLAAWVSGELLRERRAELLDTLEDLRGAGELRVEHETVMGDIGRASLDLRLELSAGGEVLYRAQTSLDSDDVWRVSWLAGPGTEWPPRATPRQTLRSLPEPR